MINSMLIYCRNNMLQVDKICNELSGIMLRRFEVHDLIKYRYAIYYYTVVDIATTYGLDGLGFRVLSSTSSKPALGST
jgi:hypothetical protein